MAAADIARTVVGIIGNVISLGLFLSPFPTFVKIVKWKSTENFSGVPYVVTLLNCLLWIFYGIPVVHPNSLLVVTINSAGCFLEMIYICIFFAYTNKKERVKVCRMLTVVVAVFVAIAVFTLTLAHTHEKRTLIVGSVCVIIGICMYAAPLTILKLVIETKSVKYMPFYLSLAAFLNGVVWTTYAGIHFDIFVTIPNGLGALLGLIQLVVFATYYERKIPEDQKDKQLPTVSEVDKMATNVTSLERIGTEQGN